MCFSDSQHWSSPLRQSIQTKYISNKFSFKKNESKGSFLGSGIVSIQTHTHTRTCYIYITMWNASSYLLLLLLLLQKTEMYFSHIANEPKSIDIIMWHTLFSFFLFHSLPPSLSLPFYLSISVGCRLDLHHFSIYSDRWCDVFRAWATLALPRSLLCQPSSSIARERKSGGKALWKYNLSLVTHKFWTRIMLLYRV